MKKHIEFLAVILSIFTSGFLMYGSIGLMKPNFTTNTINYSLDFLNMVKTGIGGGYFISSIFCGIYLFVQFISNKQLIFKILAGLLSPLTMMISVLVGFFMVVPYSIICVIRILNNMNNSKEESI